jgi:hypothetical protein
MYIKIYESGVSTLVAVCDSELIGTTAREAGLKLEISEEFYRGALADGSQVQRALCDATTANIVGKRSIEAAISCSAINPDSVIVIGGIPHAQMVRI